MLAQMLRFFTTACLQTLRSRTGQSSVEFAIILAAFISLLAALGALANLHEGGALSQHALVAASHHIQGGDTGAWDDVFAY